MCSLSFLSTNHLPGTSTLLHYLNPFNYSMRDIITIPILKMRKVNHREVAKPKSHSSMNGRTPFLKNRLHSLKYPILNALYLHLFNDYLLSTYYMIITVLGTGNTVEKRCAKHIVPIQTELMAQLSLNLEFEPGLILMLP